MPFSVEAYDPGTLAVLKLAFDAAWQDVQAATSGYSESDLIATRDTMAQRIMAAANQGERDPERLKAIAIAAIKGHEPR